jgi:outer membrane protein insertion porin family
MKLGGLLFGLCLCTVANLLDAHAAEPTAQANVPRLGQWTFTGTPIDPIAKLDAFVKIIAPVGGYFVDEGPADTAGIPIGTIPRLREGFTEIGYDTTIISTTNGGAVNLSIELRPHDRIRFVYVDGNWPLRQDQIVRRLSIRPGDAITATGKEREQFLENEEGRVLTYLHSQGYLDAKVDVELHATGKPPAPLVVRIGLKLGPGYPIGPISVKGKSTLPLDEIEDLYRHDDWRFAWLEPMPFDQPTLRTDTNNLVLRLREMGYPGARVQTKFNLRRAAARPDKTIPVELDFRQNKKIDIAFEGTTCCTDSTLLEATTILERGSYDDVEVENSRISLARFFRGRGNMFAEVSARRETVNPNHDRIVFTVKEGPRLRVQKVSAEGSRVLSSNALLNAVTVREFPLLGRIGLGEGGYASLQQLQDDVMRITDFYERIGYRGAKAAVDVGPDASRMRPIETTISGSDRSEWELARKIYVRFRVLDEGRLIRVGVIRFRSHDGSPLPQTDLALKKSILVRSGEPYRDGVFRRDAERVMKVFRDAGYPNATTEPELTENSDIVNVDMVVTTGSKVVVGPVFFRGNFHTDDRAIEQWLPLREGQVLKETDFERGQRNLAILQYFSNANPIRFPGLQGASDTVPMLIHVQERHDHYGIFRIGGGASTNQKNPDSDFPIGAFGSLGYDHGNFLGRGYLVRSRGSFGNSLTRAEADVENPRLLGTLFRLQLSSVYLRQLTARLGDIRSGSAVVGLARQIHPGLDAFLRYGVRDIVRTEPFIRAGGADTTQRSVNLDTFVGSVSFGLELWRLDNLLVPRQGFKATASIEFAEPALTLGIGDDRFFKIHGDVTSVVPVARRLSVRHSFRYDHGLPMGGTDFLPKVERFFAGGDTTLRGYELDRARTEVTRLDLGGGLGLLQFRPQGGNLRILNNLDFQYNVSGPLFAAVFIDNGIVADTVDALKPERFRHGVGITPLLVKLPVGDLSVSWAWPLNPGPGDAPAGRLHFNVGLLY